jgi:hypothetical protein
MNMRMYLLVAATLIAAISFENQSYSQMPQTAGDPLRHGHALLIGNFQYKDRGWATLDDIPLQLGALERGLKNHFDTVEVRHNRETEQLRQKINDFLQNYGGDSNARLFIYYAGHGYTEPIFQPSQNLGYITGVDTPVIDGSSRAYDAARHKAILTSEIRDASANVMAKHILFVFDSCFAGTAFAARVDNDSPAMLTPDVVSKLIEKQSRDFITAGRGNEKIPANSPIAGFFLAALYGAADRYGKGIISTAQIYQYLRDRVLPLQRLGINLTPQYGKLPLASFAEGDFLFRVTNSLAPRLTKVDIAKLFGPFDRALEKTRSDYVDTPDETKVFSVAIKEMQTAFPAWQSILSTKETHQLNPSSANAGKADVDAVYDAGLQILNEFIFDDNDVRVIGAAIKGMLAELDPHSSYLDAKSYSAMQVQTRGEFGGVGVEVSLEGGFIKVVSPLDDSPAARAGVMANDIVTHIDDAPVQGLSLNEAGGKLRGPVNTNVKLTIMRKGRDSPVEMLLTRQIVRATTVRSRLEGNDVAYIRITRFNAQTDEGLRGAINDRTATSSRASSSTCVTIQAACLIRPSWPPMLSWKAARSYQPAAAMRRRINVFTRSPATSPTTSLSLS